MGGVIMRNIQEVRKLSGKTLRWLYATGLRSEFLRQAARVALPVFVRNLILRLVLQRTNSDALINGFNRVLQEPRQPLDVVPGRILHVCGSLSPGGAERQLANTMVGLINNGWADVHALCDHLRPEQPQRYDFYRATIEGAGGRVWELPRVHQRPKDFAASGLACLDSLWCDVDTALLLGIADHYRVIRELRPEVVHAWLDWSSVRAGLAAILAGTPKVILSGRNINPTHFAFYQPYMDPIYRLLAKIPGVILINNSHAGAEDYANWLGLPKSFIRVVGNGVSFEGRARSGPAEIEALRAAHQIPRHAPVVGAAFRFYPEKDPVLWLETAAEILRRRPDCHFLLFGDGVLREQVTTLAADLGLTERLRLPGVTSDVMAAFSAMDVMLLTSRAEGTPNVVLEAGWVGTPVVATEAGGTAEALDQGRTGFIVAKREAAALAEQVCAVLAGPEIRAATLTAGPAFVRRCYGLERMIAETTALYQRPTPGALLAQPFHPEAGRILFVAGNLHPGGAERQLANTLVGIAGVKGRSVHLICDDLRRGPPKYSDFYLPRLVEAGVAVDAILGGFRWESMSGQVPAWFAPLLKALPGDALDDVAALTLEIRARRPSIVHSFLDYANVRAGLAAALCGVPKIILSCRSVAPHNFAFYKPYMDVVYQVLAERPEVVILNNSQAGADDYAARCGLPRDRIKVIYNGIDPETFDRPEAAQIEDLRKQIGVPAGAPLVGSMFRLGEEKRPLLWLEAAALVLAQVPDAHFVIFGHGPLRADMVAAAQALGVAERLHLPGVTSDVSAAYAGFQCLLLTSRIEGTPNAALEAQALGTLVVAPDVGGVAECLDPGVTGFAVAEASAETLAAAVVRCLTDDALREGVRSAGPAFVRSRFALDRLIEELLAVYDEAGPAKGGG